MEIALGAGVALGGIATYKGVSKVISKIKKTRAYKKAKNGIYKEIKEFFDEENIEKLHEALLKLKEFDIEKGTNKLTKQLSKLGLPEEVLDGVDVLGKIIEESKDKVIDAIIEAPKIVSMLETETEKVFKNIMIKTEAQRKAIDEFNLTQELEEAKRIIKEQMLEQISSQLKLGDDKLIKEEQQLAKSAQRQAAIERLKQKSTLSQRIQKSKVVVS